MPDFLKNKKDERKWQAAKKIVEEQHAKSGDQRNEASFEDRDWGLVNHIYQNNSGKTRFKRLRGKLKRGSK